MLENAITIKRLRHYPYKFDDEFRKIVEKSNLYAILDYRAGLAMSSRYAHRLHDMISFRAARQRQIERFTVEELCARLGVQTGKLARWPDFRKKALDTAIEEVNQSSRFRVSYRITKRERRKTTEVELAWEVKEVLEDAKKEQETTYVQGRTIHPNGVKCRWWCSTRINPYIYAGG